MEKRLTLDQNLCAARVFLNIMGLTLEENTSLNQLSKLNIFDKNLQLVVIYLKYLVNHKILPKKL